MSLFTLLEMNFIKWKIYRFHTMNHDPNGGEWIRFAKVIEAVEGGMTFAEASAAQSQAASGRRGGRRARG